MGRATAPVTVGMPVYNAERYLPEAIESILAQTLGDFEFIISDNASTDGTEEICRSYAAQDKRITYSRETENLGAAHNFNRVFLMARSPYFKFAASDDACAPRFLEVCLEAYQDASDDTVLCFPATIRIDEDSEPGGVVKDLLDLRETQPHARFRSFLLKYELSNCFYGVIRSAAYGSTRLHKAYDSADVVLLGELALRGQFWKLDEPLFLRRFHDRMSHKANPTPASIRSWYDPSRRRSIAFPRSKMMFEFLRAIDTTPMSTRERMRCRRELASVWLPGNWKGMIREAAANVGISIPHRT